MKHSQFLFIFFIITTNPIFCVRPPSQIFIRGIQTKLIPNYLTKLTSQQLLTLHSQEAKRTIPAVTALSWMEKYKICTNKSALMAYLCLQQRMAFPHIIPLLQQKEQEESDDSDNSAFSYYSSIKTMLFNKKDFNALLPTLQCHNLLQALRYAQQDLTGINTNKFYEEIERDSHNFATKAMQCYVCLHILQLNAPYKEKEFSDGRYRDLSGPFKKPDYDHFMQRAFAQCQTCQAHRNIEKQDLHKLDPKDIDSHNKSLIDRLPKKMQNL